MSEVEKLLTLKKIAYVRKGKDCIVHCLNPEHEDTSPSLRIDAEEGQFNCLSCGFKGNIFHLFNKHRSKFTARVKELKRKMAELKKFSWSGFSIPSDTIFVCEDFKGIPAATMTKFLAFKTSEMGMGDRMVFPIFDSRGILVGFQGRYINTDVPPKYMAYPAETPLPWYPSAAKCKFKSDSIILVEGLKDALVLHGKGLENAVCIFGTKSVNMDNILDHLHQYLIAGIQKVVILMDGDAAGRSASKNLTLCIERKTDLVVEVFELDEGVDPATMTDEQIKMLKNLLQ